MQKWTMFVLVCIAGALCVGLLLFNLPAKEEETAGNEPPAVSIPDTPVDAQAAEEVFKSNCVACHGDQLQGGMGPNLTAVGSSMDKESIYTQIVQGGNGMPGFEGKLTDEEIANLAKWLAAKK
ncbi:c-type cytochrome [Paenibacillus sepulcri]|uniref:Cytochrome c n=1 Tax=Paenibacillus sepulcri TaxID=359917 RepID=A0ABS7C5M2_9BACL|nr:cytochrome c [Paenibacillus sepulcri]